MNLEELISKYLDGELTDSEDVQLRKIISEDATARLKFDSSVNIHMAYKEDAESVFPPNDLVERTEDAILMRIFAEAPDPERKKGFLWANASMLAAMMAFFLLTFVFEIGDNSAPGLVDMSAISRGVNSAGNDLEDMTGQDVLTNESGDVSGIVGRAGFSNSDVELGMKESVVASGGGTPGGAVNFESLLSSIPEEYIGNVAAVDNEEIIKDVEDFGEVASNEIPGRVNDGSDAEELAELSSEKEEEIIGDIAKTGPEFGRLAGSGKGLSNTAGYRLLVNDYFMSDIDVQVASFFGTDILRGGIDAEDAVISHISESVAYSMNEDNRFGVELGYTEYTYYNDETYYAETAIGGTSGVEANESGHDFYLVYPYTVNIRSDKQMLWVTAFYENDVYEANGFSLVGRVGAGGSSEGFLGHGRLFTQYEIFRGIYLNLGVEGRMFQAEIPKNTIANKLKTSATLVYGFQFKF
jgi:hypothetical protein